MSRNHQESRCTADTLFGGKATLDKPIEVEQVGIGKACQAKTDDLRFLETCYCELKIKSSSFSASRKRLEPKLDARWSPHRKTSADGARSTHRMAGQGFPQSIVPYEMMR